MSHAPSLVGGITEPFDVAISSRTRRRGWQANYVRSAMVVDVAVAVLAALGAFLVRFGSPVGGRDDTYVVLSALFPVCWLGGLLLVRAYQTRFLFVGSDEFRRVLQVGVAFTALISIVSYALKAEVARGWVIGVIPLATGGTLLARYLLRKRLHWRRQTNSSHMRRLVVVGYERATANLVRHLERERHHGLEVVAACLPPDRPTRSRITDVDIPVAGDFDQAATAVQTYDADAVAVLACPQMDAEALRRLAWRLERTGADLMVAPGLMDVTGPRTTVRPAAGLPLLHVEHPDFSGGVRIVKGLFDRCAAGLLLAIIAPLLAVLVIAIRLGSPGPAVFRQVRVGRGGDEFVVFKFRTMYADAEERLQQLLGDNEHDGVLFKMRHDPRITPLGRWLRRFSLDELPQLFNVVLGHMSLVGPRPPLPREVAQYADDVRRRLVVRPGLTGLWQVSGRADLAWDETVRLDLHYVENWSMTLDLMILWKTARAVIRGSGAY